MGLYRGTTSTKQNPWARGFQFIGFFYFRACTQFRSGHQTLVDGIWLFSGCKAEIQDPATKRRLMRFCYFLAAKSIFGTRRLRCPQIAKNMPDFLKLLEFPPIFPLVFGPSIHTPGLNNAQKVPNSRLSGPPGLKSTQL